MTSELLENKGHEILVVELMGELNFISTELVLREIESRKDDSKYIILDFERVTQINVSALSFFANLIIQNESNNNKFIYIGISKMYYFSKYLKSKISKKVYDFFKQIKNIDHALEWSEDNLINDSKLSNYNGNFIPFDKHSLCYLLTDEEIQLLESLTHERQFVKDDYICKEGAAAEQLYFLMSGSVRISIETSQQKYIRLGGFSSGTSFGESALLETSSRSANVIANTPIVVKELFAKELFNCTHPLADSLLIKLYRNLLSQYDRKLRFANLHIKTLKTGFTPL